MKKKLLGLVASCLLVVLLGALAAETVDKLLIEPRTVSSWGELNESYLDFRSLMGPIVPPTASYTDAAAQMKAGDFSFLAQNWSFKFADGIYYVAEGSKLAQLKLPLHILVYEDLKRGEIVVLSSADGEKYKGEALFTAPAFMPYEKDFPADRYAFDELSPRRVVWDITLKPEADAWADLIQVDTLTAPKDRGASQMMAMSVPEEHTGDLWLGLDPQSGSMNLNVFAPDGFTNRVEIYSCTDLVSNVWSIAAQNLLPSGTNPAVWNTGSVPVHFYRAGNMDVDNDSDGINDAREQFVHKTDPARWDSDGDWIPDGWEMTNSLNALAGDSG
ncbi:MAG: hypothetical protein WC334_07575, partial [Kiritimatiellales bacterium]